MKWSKVIEDNWDAILETMQEAAQDYGSPDDDNVLRVELDRNGSVSAYWTSEDFISADVRNGVAIKIKDYYVGEYWGSAQSDNDDAVADLESILFFIRERENEIR